MEADGAITGTHLMDTVIFSQCWLHSLDIHNGRNRYIFRETALLAVLVKSIFF
jgi:hypothetical protein